MRDSTFLSMLKKVDPEYSDIAISTTGFIDTGSYIFNAALSGSLYGGFPNNRVTGLAGESGVGKSFFAMSAIRQMLANDENAQCIYFDTEFALDASFFSKRGIDAERVFILQPETVEEWKTKAINILQQYGEMPSKPQMIMVLDSLGNLPSMKEMNDTIAGENKRDMTKQQQVRSAFRTLTQKLGKQNVPMLVTAHTYQSIGSYVPTREIGGGDGLKYAASSIVEIYKKKDKDGTDVIGNIIKLRMYKSRFSKEQKVVETKLNFNTGIDRYYGLLELAEKYDIIKKVSTRYEMPDGTKVFGKHIDENPEKYYTSDIMERLEEAAKKEYSLGAEELKVHDETELEVTLEGQEETE